MSDTKEYINGDKHVHQAGSVMFKFVQYNVPGQQGDRKQQAEKEAAEAGNSSPFTPAVIDVSKAPEVISLIRQLMDGKTKPKDVLMPVRAAMEAGVIRRPTWEEFCQEFGSWRLKSKASLSEYTNPGNKPYAGPDFEAMTDQFRRLVAEGQ